MIMIDSDVFLLDNFYTDDPRYEQNTLFLHRVQNTKTYTTIFNLLEVSSIIAPYCTEKELMEFFENFDRTYNIEILHQNTYDLSTQYFLDHFFSEILQTARATGGLIESLIFTILKEYNIRVIVSWNKRIPKEKLSEFGKIDYLQPDEYVEFFSQLKKK